MWLVKYDAYPGGLHKEKNSLEDVDLPCAFERIFLKVDYRSIELNFL